MTGRRTSTMAVKGMLCAVSVAFLAACGQDTTSVNPPPPDTTGGGTVQKATLTVQVAVAPEDSAIARVLGSPGGALRGAEVTITRDGSSNSTLTAITDAGGTVRFTALLAGSYSISAVRLLSASEVALLGSENNDVTAFAGGVSTTVTPPASTATLTVSAGRRGSLVISEVFVGAPYGGDGNEYPFANFIELYNNSDTTIFLDGKVIARGIAWVSDFSSPRSCAEMERWRTDPAGIWTRYFYAFPGIGRTLPLAAGRTVVVATDAIDHRPLVGSLPDLSGAEFEFVGPSDVDNPSATNMVNIGIGEYAASVWGHGLMFRGNDGIFFIADALDPATLPHDNLPVVDPEHARIPQGVILDVFSSSLRPELQATTPFPLCQQHVNEVFDRQRTTLMSYSDLYGIQRRVFMTLPDSRKILQRTKTSSRDFEAVSPVTPGRIP
ncbi:MAG: hypothetical protein ABR543_17245 [Gemmatimonadaceae bacterium]